MAGSNSTVRSHTAGFSFSPCGSPMCFQGKTTNELGDTIDCPKCAESKTKTKRTRTKAKAKQTEQPKAEAKQSAADTGTDPNQIWDFVQTFAARGTYGTYQDAFYRRTEQGSWEALDDRLMRRLKVQIVEADPARWSDRTPWSSDTDKALRAKLEETELHPTRTKGIPVREGLALPTADGWDLIPCSELDTDVIVGESTPTIAQLRDPDNTWTGFLVGTLRTLVADPEARAHLCRLILGGLVGVQDRTWVHLNGETSIGKTSLTANVLGPVGGSAVALRELTSKYGDGDFTPGLWRAMERNARLLDIQGETGAGANKRLDNDLLKTINGNEVLTVRQKHRAEAEWGFRGTMLTRGNEAPELTDVDKALLERLHVIPLRTDPIPTADRMAYDSEVERLHSAPGQVRAAAALQALRTLADLSGPLVRTYESPAPVKLARLAILDKMDPKGALVRAWIADGVFDEGPVSSADLTELVKAADVGVKSMRGMGTAARNNGLREWTDKKVRGWELDPSADTSNDAKCPRNPSKNQPADTLDTSRPTVASRARRADSEGDPEVVRSDWTTVGLEVSEVSAGRITDSEFGAISAFVGKLREADPRWQGMGVDFRDMKAELQRVGQWPPPELKPEQHELKALADHLWGAL